MCTSEIEVEKAAKKVVINFEPKTLSTSVAVKSVFHPGRGEQVKMSTPPKTDVKMMTKRELKEKSVRSESPPPSKKRRSSNYQESQVKTKAQGISFLLDRSALSMDEAEGPPRPCETTCQEYSLSADEYDRDLSISYLTQNFFVNGTLGKGSFGNVYEVECKKTKEKFAVKQTSEPYFTAADRRRRLLEVRCLEMLRMPNITKFYRAWEEGGLLHIQIELLWKSLDAYISEVHDVPSPLVWSFLSDVSKALEYMHEINMLHLDVKPSNIMLTKDFVCKLGDFGVAVEFNDEENRELQQDGDGRYLAPEVLNNRVPRAADIFSLGVTCFEVATDCVLDCKVHDAIRHNRRDKTFEEKMPAELREVVNKMLEYEPTNRPTAAELVQKSKSWTLQPEKRVEIAVKVKEEESSPVRRVRRVYQPDDPANFTTPPVRKVPHRMWTTPKGLIDIRAPTS